MFGLYITHPQVKIDPEVPVPKWGLSDLGAERARDSPDSQVAAGVAWDAGREHIPGRNAMTVPLIGIVADRKAASYGAWVDIPNDAIPHAYVSAVQEAGGAPIIFPSLDVGKSGTRKEELLVEKDKLSKMWVLRRILMQMGTVDAMEFLLDKIKDSKTNEDFFDSMNQ